MTSLIPAGSYSIYLVSWNELHEDKDWNASRRHAFHEASSTIFITLLHCTVVYFQKWIHVLYFKFAFNFIFGRNSQSLIILYLSTFIRALLTTASHSWKWNIGRQHWKCKYRNTCTQCTVPGHKWVIISFTLCIFHRKMHFRKKNCNVICSSFLWIWYHKMRNSL